ncbi:hypothetical protein [Rubrivirga sp.]|uniref:hypothetical protein n=1 Tax=Rubrivirga sp. TaxID=1885344 RepID=UPI003B51A2FA
MPRPLALALLLPLAACATDPDAAGTTNPDVTTPAEVPPSAAADPIAVPTDTLPRQSGVPAGSATTLPE